MKNRGVVLTLIIGGMITSIMGGIIDAFPNSDSGGGICVFLGGIALAVSGTYIVYAQSENEHALRMKKEKQECEVKEDTSEVEG
jgi:hypothetical protein